MKEGFAYLLPSCGAKTLSRSNKFMMLNAAFLIGITIASFFRLGRSALLALYALAWIMCVIFLFLLRRAYRYILLIVVFGVLAGAFRFMLSEPIHTPKNISFYNGLRVEFTGVVAQDPLLSIRREQKMIVHTSRITQINNPHISLPDAVYGYAAVYVPQFPAFKAGDTIRTLCVLQDPREFGKGELAESLHKDRVWTVCEAIRTERIKEHSLSLASEILNTFRTQVDTHIGALFQEPYGGLLGGILYGSRTGLSPQIAHDFQRTGLSHITAISGYNITIMVTAFSIIAIYTGVRRQSAFWFVLITLILFVIFTGASASVVRAGIMGFLVLLSRQMGRAHSIHRVLLLSASILVLMNPRILWFDIGFQLSYLSTIGLIYGLPIVERAFIRLPAFFGLKEITLSTFSVLLATTPLILYQFGRFSLIAPLANILVLPFIPMTMALGFVALIVSFLWLPLAHLFAFVAWVPLAYIVEVVSLLSKLNFASFSIQIPLVLALAYYTVMILLVYVKSRSYQVI